MHTDRHWMIEGAYSFCGVPSYILEAAAPLAKWPTPRVLWAITGDLPNVARAVLKDAYEQAWGWWADVCGVLPAYTDDQAHANVLMGSGRIDGAKGTLAWSELPGQGRLQLNQRYDTSEPWVIAEMPPLDRIDLVRVACHEIGHALGVAHIAGGNLMAPTYDPRIRKPMPGDVAQMVERYGPAKSKPPEKKVIVLFAAGLPDGYELRVGAGPVASE